MKSLWDAEITLLCYFDALHMFQMKNMLNLQLVIDGRTPKRLITYHNYLLTFVSSFKYFFLF